MTRPVIQPFQPKEDAMQPKTKATLCFGLIGRWVYTKRNEKIEKRARIKSNLRRP